MSLTENNGKPMDNDITYDEDRNNNQNLDYDDDDDNASFKSALDVSLHESFLRYSSSYILPPRPFVDFCNEDISSDSLISEQFEDAISHDDDKISDDLSESFEQLGHEKDRTTLIAGCSDNEPITTDKNNESKGTEEDGNDEISGGNPPVCNPPISSIEPARNADEAGAVASDSSTKSEWINIDKEIRPTRATVQSLTFNQDRTCIAIATDEGYIIRTLPPLDGNEKDKAVVRVHQVPIPKGGTTHIQILHSTSLLAIVRKSTPRILALVHAKTARVVKELPFTSAVRRVEMNKMNLVILTADGALHIFMYNILDASVSRQNEGIMFLETIPILHSSESARMFTTQIASTTGAFFDLCSHVFQVDTNGAQADEPAEVIESCLVTKSAEGVGIVSVYSACRNSQPNGKPKLNLVKNFHAHDHGIARIAIGGAANQSLKQKFIATASTQGTLIRIFSLPQCEKLYDLQRGSSPCTIFSISFNYDATCIAVSSSKRTIHLFDLKKIKPCHDNEEEIDHTHLPISTTTPARWGSKISQVLGFHSDDAAAEKPLRSFAKIRKSKLQKAGEPIVQTTISLVKSTEDEEEQLIVCLGSAKIFHFAIRSDGKSRPMQVNDILSFDDKKDNSYCV